MGDVADASVALAHACRGCNTTRVTRLRLDTCLYGFPPEVPPAGRRGRKLNKGQRLPSLKSLLEKPSQPWSEAEGAWYASGRRAVRLLSGTCLWHVLGERPVERH
jgi:hypothetical protein